MMLIFCIRGGNNIRKETRQAIGITGIIVGVMIMILPFAIKTEDETCLLMFFIFGAVSIATGAYDYSVATKKETPKKRFCPNCGREIPFDSNICPYCKHDFER